MIRDTPTRRQRVVVLAVAGAGMLATAALAATSTAPDGSYGKLPVQEEFGGYGGYGGYGGTAPDDSMSDDSGSGDSGSSDSGSADSGSGDFGSGDSGSAPDDDTDQAKPDKDKKGKKGSRNKDR